MNYTHTCPGCKNKQTSSHYKQLSKSTSHKCVYCGKSYRIIKRLIKNVNK